MCQTFIHIDANLVVQLMLRHSKTVIVTHVNTFENSTTHVKTTHVKTFGNSATHVSAHVSYAAH